MPPFDIENLIWDEENEEQISRHLPSTVVQSVFDANDWIVTRNKRHQPTDRFRLIGRTLGGDLLTVVIAPTSNDRAWRPVTAYPSEPGEVQLFERTKRRQR